ncbi:MAG: hypothetical protein UR81_C0022G0004 [Candidatus Levybacteria bacterium GW2011_GWB1_35_5]|nr:MAG: hypothetical protein UR81_C0022G0004 [Candidatus Levybacteria bacterium GW2011_GWB1_35_5]
MNETQRPNIDLRGIYRPQGREFHVVVPEDLIANGIRVPEHAVAATPTWGRRGLRRYRRAIQAAGAQGR